MRPGPTLATAAASTYDAGMEEKYPISTTPPAVVAESLAPVRPEVLERARALVKEYPGCFWFRHPEATVNNRADVRVVIQHLREYGGRKAWWAAQELHKCL